MCREVWSPRFSAGCREAGDFGIGDDPPAPDTLGREHVVGDHRSYATVGDADHVRGFTHGEVPHVKNHTVCGIINQSIRVVTSIVVGAEGLVSDSCVSYGVAMPIIQRQLGHVSLATTDRYLAHIAPKRVIETMAKREWSPGRRSC